ncbi:MAG: preprotein translocase subunit SecG [Flavobacteriaceae bacterium]|nr:preprotein translocase subunit SecG [Flavobacteriaceae bacterium]
MTYYSIFIGLILIIAVLLILIIMVQNPKGGGLDSSFGGGGSQLGGVQSTNKFLDRTTWTLAISLFALILLSNIVIKRGDSVKSQLNTDGIEVPAQNLDEPESIESPESTPKKETD